MIKYLVKSWVGNESEILKIEKKMNKIWSFENIEKKPKMNLTYYYLQ